MATTATTRNATNESSNSAKTVDVSLWWEPFSGLLTELENASVSSKIPEFLEKKFADNHVWFLDTTSQFKSPNQKSKEALDSPRVKIGSHELNVQPELKEAALKISSILCLDEVQSYILVKRSLEHNNATVDDVRPNILNLVMLEYYIERQCLLKCTRQILMHAWEISDGIEVLRSYSKSCGDIIYSMLERDVWLSGEVTGTWDLGWRNGFTVEEVNEVVKDVEKLILSEIVNDLVTGFI